MIMTGCNEIPMAVIGAKWPQSDPFAMMNSPTHASSPKADEERLELKAGERGRPIHCVEGRYEEGKTHKRR